MVDKKTIEFIIDEVILFHDKNDMISKEMKEDFIDNVMNKINKTGDRENFNVLCYGTYNADDRDYYSHWSKNLNMSISKNGQTIELNETEIKQLVKSLPRTVGGSY